MGNIWEFLYQTLNVSLVAAVLLLVKWMLLDKLSPRWQYGVWCVLALPRAFAVADTAWYHTAPGDVAGKAQERRGAELGLGVHAGVWRNRPHQRAAGALRAAGERDRLALRALRRGRCGPRWPGTAYRYARLRVLLWRGQAISDEDRRGHRARGRPIFPAPLPRGGGAGTEQCLRLRRDTPRAGRAGGRVPDDKILLHELLHLKYLDALQNVFWCCLRALHWCNPFMQYVFDRVGNDMESLCDQRVLERLQGEERREYGGHPAGNGKRVLRQGPPARVPSRTARRTSPGALRPSRASSSTRAAWRL